MSDTGTIRGGSPRPLRTEGAAGRRLAKLLAEPAAVVEAVDGLVRGVIAARDRALRPGVLARRLATFDDALLVATLDMLLDRARMGETGPRVVVAELALADTLATLFDEPRRLELYGLAREAGLGHVGRLLLAPHPDRSHLEPAGRDNDHLTLPLGVRRQAARTRDRFLIDRLLRDRHPMVIRPLLANPRLREADVVTIAAARPQNPAVLRLVATSRWGNRYAVRKALACNPYTPEEIATRLLPTLLVQDLRFLVGSGALLPDLERLARQVVAERLRARSHPQPGGRGGPPGHEG